MSEYKLIDLQGIETHNDDVFHSIKALKQHIIDYHTIDYMNEEDLEDKSLPEILDYTELRIELIKK